MPPVATDTIKGLIATTTTQPMPIYNARDTAFQRRIKFIGVRLDKGADLAGVSLMELSKKIGDVRLLIAAVFRGAWHPRAMVQAFVLGIVIAMIVAFIPTRRALKMRITDCLRDE